MEHSPKKISLLVISIAVALLAVAGFFWLKGFSRAPQQSPAVALPAQTQFIPKGAAPLEADQALAAFGFTKPLPFFDKKNVVESFNTNTNVSVSTNSSSPRLQPGSAKPTIFLSYRVSGQNKASVRDALINYLKNSEWRMIKISGGDQATIAFFTAHQSMVITLAEVSKTSGADQSTIVVAFTMRSISSPNR